MRGDLSEVTNSVPRTYASPCPNADLTVIIVSYNTRQLTLNCLKTLFENTRGVKMRVVVFDNDSKDQSAEAVEANFPQVTLMRSAENVGFARANNLAAASVDTDWILLLNPDTEIHDDAVSQLFCFATAHKQAGITGGRTVFADGSLNIASCWNKMTPWSLFCQLTGASHAFPNSSWLNPEAIGGWRRDSVRQVDIVVGCFLMISTSLWNQIGGFDPRYFMYGEEADLCLKARALGYKPMITPDAEIMHLVGASSAHSADKLVLVWKAKVTLIRDHWPRYLAPLGIFELWASCAIRRYASTILASAKLSAGTDEKWRLMWDRRQQWLNGY